MMHYQNIIDFFYPQGENDELRHILLTHSRSVAELAIKICKAHPELHADEDFVYAAAMLHDIGIVRCDAPGIHCHGTEHYLRHGVVGAQMLLEYSPDLGDYARVCARHTGTGLTEKSIREQNLPLPPQDLRPETIEEQIICYADKFFSKTHLDRQKTYEQALRSLERFGKDGLMVFKQWHERFNCMD